MITDTKNEEIIKLANKIIELLSPQSTKVGEFYEEKKEKKFSDICNYLGIALDYLDKTYNKAPYSETSILMLKLSDIRIEVSLLLKHFETLR